jgi:uncharacterized protein
LSSPDNPRFDLGTEPPPLTSAETPAAVPLTTDPLSSDPATSALLAPVDLTPLPVAPPPVENPVWSGWDVLAIGGLTLVAMLIAQLGVLLVAHRFLYPHASMAQMAQKPILLLISQFLIYAAVAACMVLLVRGKYHEAFWKALRWNFPRSVWTPLGIGVVLFMGLAVLQNFLPMPKDTAFEHLFDRPRDAYLLSIIAVSLGPLMEELFFRGFLYPVLARRMGVVWGVLLTALPFGLIHLPQYGNAWAAGLVIFLVGVACGAVRAATKSVGASFLVHVGYNGTQMLIAVVATHGFRHMEKALAVCWR